MPAFENMPATFRLSLSAGGAANRLYRLAWRKGNYVGVEYLKDPIKQPKSVAAWRTFYIQAQHDAAAAAAEETSSEP